MDNSRKPDKLGNAPRVMKERVAADSGIRMPIIRKALQIMKGHSATVKSRTYSFGGLFFSGGSAAI